MKSKTRPKVICKRRNSILSTPLKSFPFSVLRPRRLSPAPSLVTIPTEILNCIFKHLPQLELQALMLTNSNLIEIAATHLYNQPHFASPYRYGQFVKTVSRNEKYAEMVRVLDLSYFGRENENDRVGSQAGWREFKHQNHDMHQVWNTMMMIPQVTREPKAPPTLPATPSPFVKGFHRTRDMPLGGICHVLGACKKIRKLNLNHLQLASDFLIHVPHRFTPAPLFTSDAPSSWTWRPGTIVPLYADEVIAYLVRLPCLESLTARNCLWLTAARVERLLRGAGERLGSVDFRESGMRSGARWAVRGSRGEVGRIVGDVAMF